MRKCSLKNAHKQRIVIFVPLLWLLILLMLNFKTLHVGSLSLPVIGSRTSDCCCDGWPAAISENRFGCSHVEQNVSGKSFSKNNPALTTARKGKQ